MKTEATNAINNNKEEGPPPPQTRALAQAVGSTGRN